MDERIQDYYARLGLLTSASFEEVKSAYRRLVKQWHPDQFCHDPRQQQQADEFIKQINEAYDYLKIHGQGSPEDGSIGSSFHAPSTVHKARRANATEHYDRGVVFAKEGKYTDALDAFSMAIRLNSDYAAAYQYRGFIYSVLGYENRAESDLRKAKSFQHPTPSPFSGPTSTSPSEGAMSTANVVETPWACSQVLLGHRDTISALAFSRDRRILISSSWDGDIRLWNLRTGETFGAMAHGGAVYAIALSPEGDHLASAGKDGNIRLWHWKTGTLVRTLHGHSSTVKSLAFTPNRRQIVSASFDHTLKLWDIQRGEELHTFTGTAPLWAVSVNPDGQTLISGGEDQQIQVWNLQTRHLIRTYPCTVKYIYAIACHPNRQDVVLGTSERNVLRFNIHAHTFPPSLAQHTQAIRSVAISPSGRWIASGSSDRTVTLWNPAHSPVSLNGHTDEIMAVTFSPDEQLLASAGAEQSIRIWEAKTDGVCSFSPPC